ncbi:MAG TPA: hypothetical protein VJ955_08455, partial [Desulfuromonadales bacterium]|nr:hypothetical protein [Desulfuromonadales bacterium]
MKKTSVGLLCLLAFGGSLAVSPALAWNDALPGVPLEGLQFGEAPLTSMVCFSGSCAADSPKEQASLIASYNKPLVLTFFGGAAIAPPKYDYFENQLFRISFALRCRPDQAEKNFKNIAAALTRDYGLTPVDTLTRTAPGCFYEGRNFRTDDGTVVVFSRK